jgi:hypothetical protein
VQQYPQVEPGFAKPPSEPGWDSDAVQYKWQLLRRVAFVIRNDVDLVAESGETKRVVEKDVLGPAREVSRERSHSPGDDEQLQTSALLLVSDGASTMPRLEM